MDQTEAMEALLKKLARPGKILDANLISNSINKGSNLMALPEMESADPNIASEFSVSQLKRKSKASNFLKIYFDFAFYACCSPFHFVVDRNGWFAVKSFKPQQVVCTLLHLLGILRLLTEVRRTVPDALSQNPEQYFAVIGGGFRLLFKILTMKRVWCNQLNFLEIMNFMAGEKMLPNSEIKLQHKYVVTSFCVLCTIMPLAMASSNCIATPITSWDRTWWNRIGLVSDGQFAFFMINRTEYIRRTTTMSSLPEETTPFDYFLAIVQGIGLLERLIIGFYYDACLLFAVLTLWCTTQAFAKDLRANDHRRPVWTDLSSSSGKCVKASAKWTDLYKSYKGIRSLSHLINSAFGGMTTTYVAESILYHSMNLDAFVLTSNVLIRIHLLFFAVSSSLTFLFSADICSQLDTLKLWLANDDNRRTVPLDELNIVLHELNTGVIGIRGSNIFTITYSLVWNVATTVVTFFIINLQSRGGSKTLDSFSTVPYPTLPPMSEFTTAGGEST